MVEKTRGIIWSILAERKQMLPYCVWLFIFLTWLKIIMMASVAHVAGMWLQWEDAMWLMRTFGSASSGGRSKGKRLHCHTAIEWCASPAPSRPDERCFHTCQGPAAEAHPSPP